MEFMSVTTISGLMNHETYGLFCIFFLRRAQSKVFQNLSEIGQNYSFSFHKEVNKNPFFSFQILKEKKVSLILLIYTYQLIFK